VKNLLLKKFTYYDQEIFVALYPVTNFSEETIAPVSRIIICKGRQKNKSSRDEIHEKNSRIHLDRLQNKYTNCKEIKNNISYRQFTGIQEKLDTTCK